MRYYKDKLHRIEMNPIGELGDYYTLLSPEKKTLAVINLKVQKVYIPLEEDEIKMFIEDIRALDSLEYFDRCFVDIDSLLKTKEPHLALKLNETKSAILKVVNKRQKQESKTDD